MNVEPSGTITLAKFSQMLGARFRVGNRSGDSIELELVQVSPGGTIAKGGANLPEYESFSLLFHGAQAGLLRQGTYAFEHPALGRFDLFIVPIAAENGLVQYQAVFNRLISPV
jgi:hypothetical protein